MRHSLRSSPADAVLLQQPVRRLSDLPRVRQRHRARHGPRRARPVEVDHGGRHRAVEQAALPVPPGRSEARRAAARRPDDGPVVRPVRQRTALRHRGRRRGVRRHPGVLPLARAEEVQGARAGVPEPLSRLPHLRRVRGDAAAARGARRARRGELDRPGLPVDGSRGPPVLRRSGADRQGAGDRGAGHPRDPPPARVPERRRPRLPDARPPVVDPLGRRGPAHQPRHLARILPRRHALRARRAVHRPASPRQRAAHPHPGTAPRPGQHRAGGRARRGHDPGERLRRRPRAGRGHARRARGLRRPGRRPGGRDHVPYGEVPARRA